MKKISFNQGTLAIDENQIFFELPARELMIDTPKELDPIFQLPDLSFSCQVNRSDDRESFFFLYQIEPGFLPFQQGRTMDRPVKLAIVDQLVRIAYYFETQTQLVTVFHPLNFFVDAQGRVKLLYRGVKGLMPADGYEQEPIIDQVRRLLLLLFSEARFDEIRLNGNKQAYQQALAGERPLIKKWMEATDLNELLSIIQQERQSVAVEQKASVLEKVEQKTTPPIVKKPAFLALTDSGKKGDQLPLLPGRRQRLIDWFKALRRHKLLYILSLLTIGSLLFLTIIYLMIQNSFQPLSFAGSQSSPALAGLRYAAIQDFTNASKEFAKIDFKKLDREDQKAVIFTYLRAGQYERVLSLDRNYMDVVVAYLERTNQKAKLLNISSDLPEVRFEQAGLSDDVQTMMSLRKKIKMDRRRHQMIINAFIEKHDEEGAKKYAASLGLDPEGDLVLPEK